MEAPDSGCQDKLTHLIFPSSHPKGTSSPEKRGHSNTDAAELQLDSHHPVLVGSELGERRLRPLPMTLRPTSGSSPFSPLVSHLECGRKSFPQAYAKRGSGLSFSEGEGLTQSPISFRCVQGPPRIQPHRIF